jgi:hypothetical protein
LVAEFNEDKPAYIRDEEGEDGGDDSENCGEGEGLEEGLGVVEGCVEIVFAEKVAIDKSENLEIHSTAEGKDRVISKFEILRPVLES